MKKANKILMASVAILLSLVLITTSVVSGVFAKFAIRKNTTTTMKLEKFGVTLSLAYSSAFSGAGATVVENSDGNSLTVEIKDFKMLPGDSYADAIKFDFSGKTNVRCRLNIDFDMIINPQDFIVPKEVAGKLDSAVDMFYWPWELSYDVWENYSIYEKNETKHNDAGMQPEYTKADIIEQHFYSSLLSNVRYDKGVYSMYNESEGLTYKHDMKLTGKDYSNSATDNGKSTDLSLEKIFAAGSDIKINATFYDSTYSFNRLYFKMAWPIKEEIANATYSINEMESYIAYKKNPTLTMRFTITFEQVPDNYSVPDLVKVTT